MPGLKNSKRAPAPFPGAERSRRTVRRCVLPLLLALGLAPLAHADQARQADQAMPAETLAPLMAGEFALQSGQLDEAARWYLDAARAAEGDVPLAERATRIAILANDDGRAAEALALWRARAPESPGMRTASATLALRAGKLRQAGRDLEALLASEDPRGWRFAASALNGGRDPQAIARVLDRLVRRGAIPDDIAAWQEFGRMALRLDEPKLARRIMDQVVRRFPGEPRVVLLRATQLQQAGQTAQAREILAQVEPLARTDPEMRAMLAIAYESVRDLASAARVMAEGQQDTTTYGVRASLLARAGDNEALGVLYAELAEDASRPDPSRRLLLGRIAEFLERPAEALGWYRGVAGGPQRTEARMRAAVALHNLGRREEAYAEARALQDDAGVADEVRRDAYLLEAEMRQREGDHEGELEVLGRGIAAWPDDPALLYARGLAWERQDRIDRAEADLRRVLVTDPENVAALNALGYTLADRTDRYREALELIDRARTAEPDNAAIVDSYGWVLYRLGRSQEALVELRRAWGLMKDPEIAAHLGEVLWTLGRRADARRYFEEARALDPENRALLRALEQFGITLPPAAAGGQGASTDAGTPRPAPEATP
ncbi:hypothetical protein CSC68_13585 [Pseudoxanthomonas suwonensis]|nr:hypothetical protein CSC68_13585 [Pseudoxanthomonas suwonensis]